MVPLRNSASSWAGCPWLNTQRLHHCSPVYSGPSMWQMLSLVEPSHPIWKCSLPSSPSQPFIRHGAPASCEYIVFCLHTDRQPVQGRQGLCPLLPILPGTYRPGSSSRRVSKAETGKRGSRARPLLEQSRVYRLTTGRGQLSYSSRSGTG